MKSGPCFTVLCERAGWMCTYTHMPYSRACISQNVSMKMRQSEMEIYDLKLCICEGAILHAQDEDV